MIEKYRLHEVAKDLGVASKEVVDLLAERIPGERKSMTALNEQELSVVPVSYTHLDVYKRQGYGRPAPEQAQ